VQPRRIDRNATEDSTLAFQSRPRTRARPRKFVPEGRTDSSLARIARKKGKRMRVPIGTTAEVLQDRRFWEESNAALSLFIILAILAGLLSVCPSGTKRFYGELVTRSAAYAFDISRYCVVSVIVLAASLSASGHPRKVFQHRIYMLRSEMQRG
jgi:hypothetical protein